MLKSFSVSREGFGGHRWRVNYFHKPDRTDVDVHRAIVTIPDLVRMADFLEISRENVARYDARRT